MKRLLNLGQSKRSPVDDAPAPVLPGGEMEPAALPSMEQIDRTAGHLTQVAAMALNGAGVEKGEPAVIKRSAGTPPERRESTGADDLIKHILGDQRIRTTMQRRQFRQSQLRRATT